MVALFDYIAFARNHTRFLGFGFLLAFTSSVGQTYFIGIFGPEIRETFNLSHTQWGSIYLVGTLCSALVLPWSGNIIDRVDLRYYVAAVVTGLTLACVMISYAPTILILTISIFLLRQFGQGLTSFASVTSMARYMGRDRGKGIAIASMGYSAGEASLPFFAVLAIAALGWRTAYIYTALGVLILLPVILWLLKGQRQRHETHLTNLSEDAKKSAGLTVSKTRREMLTEFRFYLLLPAVLAPSYVGTGLFFHHLTLAESKGWSGLWVTGNYWIYAVFTIITSLISGPLIDKFTAARVIPYYLVPMIAGLLLLVPAQNALWVMPYMILIGINTGIMFTALSALWPELYGPRYLGGIKSLVGAISVFASALGPVTIGVLLDNGFSFEEVCMVFAAFCAVATVLLIIGLGKFRRNA
jgi:MFS family permease